jgi:hypothetical protein
MMSGRFEPVAGTVIERKVIQGQAYLDVKTKPAIVDGKKVTVLNALDGTGPRRLSM